MLVFPMDRLRSYALWIIYLFHSFHSISVETLSYFEMAYRLNTAAQIPNEILELILLLLPSKRLITIQTVNHHWRSLILHTSSLRGRLCLETYHCPRYKELRERDEPHLITINQNVTLAVPWFHWALGQTQLFLQFPERDESTYRDFESFVSLHRISEKPKDHPLSSVEYPPDSRRPAGSCQNKACWCVQQLTHPPTRAVQLQSYDMRPLAPTSRQPVAPQYIIHDQGITIGQLARCILDILRYWYKSGRSEILRPLYNRVFRKTFWIMQIPGNTIKEREWFHLYKTRIQSRQNYSEWRTLLDEEC